MLRIAAAADLKKRPRRLRFKSIFGFPTWGKLNTITTRPEPDRAVASASITVRSAKHQPQLKPKKELGEQEIKIVLTTQQQLWLALLILAQ
jgi:hypothetical protein